MNEREIFPSVVPDSNRKSSVYSASETQEVRHEAIKKALSVQLGMLQKSQVRTDLHDLTAVQATTENYIHRCSEAGLMPNFEGVAASLGISRKWAYEYIRKFNSDPTAEYLNTIRLSLASIRMTLSEGKVLDPASSIFILKNSDMGYADRVEITPAEPQSPYTTLSEEQLKQKYLADMTDDD